MKYLWAGETLCNNISVEIKGLQLIRSFIVFLFFLVLQTHCTQCRKIRTEGNISYELPFYSEFLGFY